MPEQVPKASSEACSWRSTRNAFLEVIQERNFWKMKNCLQPYEMARNKFWEHVFVVRGTVWNNRDFTPPPSEIYFRIEIVHRKIHEKICICISINTIIPYNQWQCQSRFQKRFRSVFLEVSQECVPGGLPGTRFLKTEKLTAALWKGKKQILRKRFYCWGDCVK